MTTKIKSTKAIVLARITGRHYPSINIENELLSSYFKKGTIPLSGVVYLCSGVSIVASKNWYFSNDYDISMIYPYLVLSKDVDHTECIAFNNMEVKLFMAESRYHIDNTFIFLLEQNKILEIDEIDRKDLNDRIFYSSLCNKSSEFHLSALNHVNETLAFHSKIKTSSSLKDLQSTVIEWVYPKVYGEFSPEMNDCCLLVSGKYWNNQEISNVIQYCAAVIGMGMISIESQFLLSSESFIKQFDIHSKTSLTESYLSSHVFNLEIFEKGSQILIYIENIDYMLEKFSTANDTDQSDHFVDIFLDNIYKLLRIQPKLCFIAATRTQFPIPTKLLTWFTRMSSEKHILEHDPMSYFSNYIENYVESNNWQISPAVLIQMKGFVTENYNTMEDVETFLNEICLESQHKRLESHLSSDSVNIEHCNQSWLVTKRVLNTVTLKLSRTVNFASRGCNNAGDKKISVNQKISKVYWEDIGGLESVRKEILDMIELPLKYQYLFPAGSPRRHGILLYGPPGTGKTLVAKAVATECNMKFLSIKGPELLDAYVGESEKNIRDLFSNALSQSPCILFFDEIDSIAPSRAKGQDSGGGVMDRIVSQLLTEIDRLSTHSSLVFVIAATNRPDLLDVALLRPGRFDRRIFLGSSTTVQAKVSVLKAQTRMFHLAKNVNLHDIAKTFPAHVTGADIGSICSNAYTAALRRKLQDINSSIQSTSSNFNGKDDLHKYIADNVDSYLRNLPKRQLRVVLCLEDFIQAVDELVPTQYDHRYYDEIEKMYSS